MTITFSIRAEYPTDHSAISDLHHDAFGPDDPIPALIAKLRQLRAPFPTLSFVAHTPSEEILGHVMLSHGWLDAPRTMRDILVLSPLGVAPKAQGHGIGTALVQHAIKEASRTTAPILFLEGDPAFYGPRGFEASKPHGIRSPSLRIPEAALQMVRLPAYDQEATGTLVYRELWWDMDCVGLR